MCNCRFAVSLILPVYNAEKWLDACLQSVLNQTYLGPMELCIYNDASTDKSMSIVNNFFEKLTNRKIKVVVSHPDDHTLRPKGELAFFSLHTIF